MRFTLLICLQSTLVTFSISFSLQKRQPLKPPQILAAPYLIYLSLQKSRAYFVSFSSCWKKSVVIWFKLFNLLTHQSTLTSLYFMTKYSGPTLLTDLITAKLFLVHFLILFTFSKCFKTSRYLTTFSLKRFIPYERYAYIACCIWISKNLSSTLRLSS